MQRIKVESKSLDGAEVVVYVVKPNDRALSEGKKAANLAFREALVGGALLRSKIESYMVEQGLWDEAKTNKVRQINLDVESRLRKLKKGGIDVDEAKATALQVRDLRSELTSLLSKQRQLDNFSAEAQADNANFDALVVACTLDEDGKRVFKDSLDYKSKGSEPYAMDAASKLADLAFGLNPDWERELPENKFLVEYGFCNSDLEFVNENGDRVSRDGKRIDSEGRYLNEDGQFIDVNGNLVDENGDPIEEFTPFTRNGEAVIK